MDPRADRRRPIDPDLYLVVDGDADYTFWRNHLAKHFPRARNAVDNLKGKDPAEEFNRIVHFAERADYAHVVFLTDEDASPDPAIRVRRLRAKLDELRRMDRKIANRVRVFGVRRGLECWFLADEKAVREAFPRSRYRCKARTDSLTDPKSLVRQMYEKAYGSNYAWSEVGFACKMACKIEFIRASKWSSSLYAFWREMGKPFANWR